MTATAAKPKIEIRHVGPGHAPALAEFFRQVWDPGATTESVEAAMIAGAAHNLANPNAPVPTTIVVADDRIVGYCSSIPVRLWNGRQVWPGYWAKGLMVLPEYRNGPIGFLVLKELIAHLPRSVVLTVAPPSVRLFQALGFQNLGMVPNYLGLLRPGRIGGRVDVDQLFGRVPGAVAGLARLAQQSGALELGGAAIGLPLRLFAGLHRVVAIGLRTATRDPLPSPVELDGLWHRACEPGRAGVIRDAVYLERRYGAGAAADRYQYVTVRDRRRLRALAVVRRPRLQDDPRVRGLSVGALADLVVRRGDTAAAAAALGGAVELGRELEGDALLASSSCRWLRRVLFGQGWLPAGANLNFLVRETDGAVPWPESLAHWWLMRGDGHSDEAL